MGYSLREALAAFRRTPILAGLSAAMIALSLFVVGLFGVAAHNIRLVLDQVEARIEVVAYLHDEASSDQIDAIQSEIRRLPDVRDVVFISRTQALEIARSQLRDFETVFLELDTNPFPASLEVSLVRGQRNPDAVHRVARAIAEFPAVEDVRYGQEWLDKVYLLRRVAAAAAFVVGGAFAAVAAIIISAAIRLAIFARREEIAIMQLVGATTWFIRRPFLLEGLFAGALGSAAALAATYLVYGVLSDSVVQLEWIPGLWVTAGAALGCVFGVLASYWAVHRHLQEL